MREYHPLDVRHPSNRDLLSRNYLLDPPSPDAGADKLARRDESRPGESRRSGSRPAASRPVPAAIGHREAPEPVAPWGRRERPDAAATPLPQTRRQGGSFWWNATIILVFLVIFASQNGMMAGFLDTLRDHARQMGIALPF